MCCHHYESQDVCLEEFVLLLLSLYIPYVAGQPVPNRTGNPSLEDSYDIQFHHGPHFYSLIITQSEYFVKHFFPVFGINFTSDFQLPNSISVGDFTRVNIFLVCHYKMFCFSNLHVFYELPFLHYQEH